VAILTADYVFSRYVSVSVCVCGISCSFLTYTRNFGQNSGKR